MSTEDHLKAHHPAGLYLPADRETYLNRWHDLDFRRCPWGTYVVNGHWDFPVGGHVISS